MTNEDLGYNSIFEENRNKLGLGSFLIARVIFESKGAYNVKNVNGEYRAKITGKKIFTASSREDYPAVGDWVAIVKLDNKSAVIHTILPRLTMIKRRCGNKNKSGEKDQTQVIATNIDVAFVIESVDRDYSLNRFERYFSITKNGRVKPVIILNKIDLLPSKELQDKLAQLKDRFPEIDIISTSVVNDNGLDDLKKYILKGKTYCFLGSSGVGKSSLINKLLDNNFIKTRDISSYSGRGKHTTTARHIYFLKNGGIVIDNPGIREVGIVDEQQGIDNFFDDITSVAKQCRYFNCTHTHEPDCKVIEAIKYKKLDEKKYLNYLSLKKEAKYYDMDNNEKRLKDRQFGKFIKKAKKDLKYFAL